jgi:hypothetical protein
VSQVVEVVEVMTLVLSIILALRSPSPLMLFIRRFASALSLVPRLLLTILPFS